jgi:two-component system response regulator AtoC
MEKILIIDDDETERHRWNDYLGRRGFATFTASTGCEGMEKVRRENPNIVILDKQLPDADGLTLLPAIHQEHKDACVVMVTAFHNMDTVISAMQLGAYEYLSKPIHSQELDQVIARAINQETLHQHLHGISPEEEQDNQTGNIVAKSRAMERIFKKIGLVSNTKTTVLLEGESGTGKELIARAIHRNGPQRDLPFVSINCSAIVETLLESELFGHEKGSFTGATHRRIGKFEYAGEGTVFLDEISEMAPGLQSKLLRVLQEREFERVGGTERIAMRARIIAATNRNLAEWVEDGKFREDLYYRLEVVTIKVPPLRERREDIPFLVEHFLNKANAELHKSVVKVPEQLMEELVRHEWRGNVRELENFIIRNVALSQGDVLEGNLEFHSEPRASVFKDTSVLQNLLNGRSLDDLLSTLEKEVLLLILEKSHWNKSDASKKLGIHRTTLISKLKKYGLMSPS